MHLLAGPEASSLYHSILHGRHLDIFHNTIHEAIPFSLLGMSANQIDTTSITSQKPVEHCHSDEHLRFLYHTSTYCRHKKAAKEGRHYRTQQKTRDCPCKQVQAVPLLAIDSSWSRIGNRIIDTLDHPSLNAIHGRLPQLLILDMKKMSSQMQNQYIKVEKESERSADDCCKLRDYFGTLSRECTHAAKPRDIAEAKRLHKPQSIPNIDFLINTTPDIPQKAVVVDAVCLEKFCCPGSLRDALEDAIPWQDWKHLLMKLLKAMLEDELNNEDDDQAWEDEEQSEERKNQKGKGEQEAEKNGNEKEMIDGRNSLEMQEAQGKKAMPQDSKLQEDINPFEFEQAGKRIHQIHIVDPHESSTQHASTCRIDSNSRVKNEGDAHIVPRHQVIPPQY